MKHLTAVLGILFLLEAGIAKGQMHRRRPSQLSSSSHDSPLLSEQDTVTIYFTSGSSRFTPTTFRKLSCIAKSHRVASQQKIVVTGGDGASYDEMERSWEQVYNVIEYLHDSTELTYSNFIFKYSGNTFTKLNTVKLRLAGNGETGDSIVAPPAPRRGHLIPHY